MCIFVYGYLCLNPSVYIYIAGTGRCGLCLWPHKVMFKSVCIHIHSRHRPLRPLAAQRRSRKMQQWLRNRKPAKEWYVQITHIYTYMYIYIYMYIYTCVYEYGYAYKYRTCTYRTCNNRVGQIDWANVEQKVCVTMVCIYDPICAYVWERVRNWHSAKNCVYVVYTRMYACIYLWTLCVCRYMYVRLYLYIYIFFADSVQNMALYVYILCIQEKVCVCICVCVCGGVSAVQRICEKVVRFCWLCKCVYAHKLTFTYKWHSHIDVHNLYITFTCVCTHVDIHTYIYSNHKQNHNSFLFHGFSCSAYITGQLVCACI